MRQEFFRKFVAIALCWFCAQPLSFAQQGNQDTAVIPEQPKGSIFFRPYRAPFVPEPQFGNSGRLAGLIRGGKLYLTVQDAIALALENNIDIEVSRYSSILDVWNLKRSEAGGALPGVPSASSQASSVTRGEGVRGSEAAAGVSVGGANGSGTNTVNATVTQIGPVTPNLDPVLQDTTTFSHLSQPQANVKASDVANLIDNQRNYNVSLQNGFLTGTQATINYTEGYLNENAPTDILNPQYAPTLSATVTQQFLQGFGVDVNSRTINVGKLNLKIDNLNFKSEVISVVVNVLNLYYGLGADYEDVKAKQSAVDVARQFYENNKKQVSLGALAPLDVVSAESQVALSEENLENSRATLQQQEISLKNVLSRNGTADPLLANTEIIPLDHIDVPQNEDFPPLPEMVAKAIKNRVDLEAEKMHITVDQLNALGTKNNVLPVLAAQASTTNQGLSGGPQLVPQGPIPTGTAVGSQQYPAGFRACPAPNAGQVCEVPDSYFVGGLNNAVGQILRRDFPSENAAIYLFARLRNRQAQADYAIDQLSMRQDEIATQRDLNQVAVDVQNQVVALRQARVRYLAAVKNRELSQQLLDAEQKKFSLGASTPYNVVSQQRDLAAAQSTEIAAVVAYSTARIALGNTLGTTLDDVHVTLDEARKGIVTRTAQR